MAERNWLCNYCHADFHTQRSLSLHFRHNPECRVGHPLVNNNDGNDAEHYGQNDDIDNDEFADFGELHLDEEYLDMLQQNHFLHTTEDLVLVECCKHCTISILDTK